MQIPKGQNSTIQEEGIQIQPKKLLFGKNRNFLRKHYGTVVRTQILLISL
jgi:hypothetical protein